MTYISGKTIIDQMTVLFTLEIARSQIVLLHAILEAYDGVAVVKSVDESKGIVCLITTPDLESLCDQLLLSLKREIPWRYYQGNVQLDEIFQYVER